MGSEGVVAPNRPWRTVIVFRITRHGYALAKDRQLSAVQQQVMEALDGKRMGLGALRMHVAATRYGIRNAVLELVSQGIAEQIKIAGTNR